MSSFKLYFFCSLLLAITVSPSLPAVLTVGQGKEFANITSAIINAAEGDTLDIYGTITADGVKSNGIIINKNIVIRGRGIDLTIIEGSSKLNESDRRVFSILSGKTVYLQNLTLRNGSTTGNGGAIENLGNLYLTNCLIENNIGRYGGAIRNGISANLIIDKCILRNNTAYLRGGAINHIGNHLQIIYSTIENNQAYDEGGGIQIENAPADISNCLIYNNILIADSINSNGAGLFAGSSGQGFQVKITNCTFSGNKGKTSGNFLSCGGGIGIISVKGHCVFSLINCTLTRNQVYCGQAIQAYSFDDSASIEINLLNCIISNGLNDNFFGFTQNGGKILFNRSFTILEDNTISVAGQGNMNFTEAELEELAENGGPTKTHALKPTSPAIDAGTSSGAPPFDQRGALRNGNTDIGAYEFGGILSFPRIRQKIKGINIYPNPCSNHLTIESDLNDSYLFELTDISGKILLHWSPLIEFQQIDLRSFNTGMYLLKIRNTSGDYFLAEKILKTK